MYIFILILIAIVIVIIYAMFFEDKTAYWKRNIEDEKCEEKIETQYRVLQIITDGKTEWFPQANYWGDKNDWHKIYPEDDGMDYGDAACFKSKKKALEFIAKETHIPKVEEKIHFI